MCGVIGSGVDTPRDCLRDSIASEQAGGAATRDVVIP
jgi:hypothetical protein